tara:strand:- start:61410 stop:61670 length:261 start_codon:yes stop_codon:yes gene_type:complete
LNIEQQKKELYQRTYNLERESLDALELQKELKGDFEYNAETNTNGLPKDDVKRIMKAAKESAKANDLKGKAKELLEIDSLIGEMEA